AFHESAEGLVRRLPYVLAALVALGLTAVVARVVRRTVERALRRGGAERHVGVGVAPLAFYGAAPGGGGGRVGGARRRGGAERHVVVVVATLAFYGAVAVGLVVALSLGGVNLGGLVGRLGLAPVGPGFALQDS